MDSTSNNFILFWQSLSHEERQSHKKLEIESNGKCSKHVNIMIEVFLFVIFALWVRVSMRAGCLCTQRIIVVYTTISFLLPCAHSTIQRVINFFQSFPSEVNLSYFWKGGAWAGVKKGKNNNSFMIQIEQTIFVFSGWFQVRY